MHHPPRVGPTRIFFFSQWQCWSWFNQLRRTVTSSKTSYQSLITAKMKNCSTMKTNLHKFSRAAKYSLRLVRWCLYRKRASGEFQNGRETYNSRRPLLGFALPAKPRALRYVHNAVTRCKNTNTKIYNVILNVRTENREWNVNFRFVHAPPPTLVDGYVTSLAVAVHEGVLCPTPLVRTNTASPDHLLHRGQTQGITLENDGSSLFCSHYVHFLMFRNKGHDTCVITLNGTVQFDPQVNGTARSFIIESITF
jgi:hypothetical protein